MNIKDGVEPKAIECEPEVKMCANVSSVTGIEKLIWKDKNNSITLQTSLFLFVVKDMVEKWVSFKPESFLTMFV